MYYLIFFLKKNPFLKPGQHSNNYSMSELQFPVLICQLRYQVGQNRHRFPLKIKENNENQVHDAPAYIQLFCLTIPVEKTPSIGWVRYVLMPARDQFKPSQTSIKTYHTSIYCYFFNRDLSFSILNRLYSVNNPYSLLTGGFIWLCFHIVIELACNVIRNETDAPQGP